MRGSERASLELIGLLLHSLEVVSATHLREYFQMCGRCIPVR